MIDSKSPEFQAELKRLIEEALETYKLKTLRETFATKEEFKDDTNKIWQELQKQHESEQKQWEEHQKQWEEHQKQQAKRWDEQQKHWDEQQKHWEEHQNDNNHRFDNLDNSLRALTQATQMMMVDILNIQNKTGAELEHLILEVVKETLRMEQIDPQLIHKEYMKDSEGIVLDKGETTDIDIVTQNGNVYLLEVKATADNRDVKDLLEKAKLYEHIFQRKPTRLVLVVLRIKQRNIDYATRFGIKIIQGKILPDD